MASLDRDRAAPKYDIFINYLYEDVDVKRKFVSHIYHRLLPHGLRVFMEKEETTQIDEVIRTAPIHIAIFSPGYQNSPRCLNELLLMSEPSTSSIIPVFYKMRPGQIRWAMNPEMYVGPHGGDLVKRKRSAKKKREKWVRALSDVTGINGFVLEHCNGDEGKLVGQVVERVLNMLKDHLDYDVFINHRGPDVKKTLASHLYHGLVECGLRVFLDIEEMHEGDSLTSQIEGAIRTAFVHIAIFSGTYAKSRWCLDELVLMLESGRIIIPVFHNVKPSELTLKNGKYDEHLRELEKEIDEGKLRYDPATIGEWKKALSDVDKYTAFGFDLEQFDGDEGQLADEVIQRVLSEEVKVWKDGRHLR